MQARIVFIILVVAGSIGCHTGERQAEVAISQEQLPDLIPLGMNSSDALQLISDHGYCVQGPEIRDLVLRDRDSSGEYRTREWRNANIATCSITWQDGLVTGTNTIYVVLDNNMQVKETIEHSTFTGP